MSLKFEIDEFLSIFTHHKTNYIHFALKEKSGDFLYLISEDEKICSLFFGSNFRTLIPLLRSDPDVKCIECDMGLNIQGGVSYDSEDLVEFSFTTDEANSIIDLLDKSKHPNEINFRLCWFNNNEES